MKNLLHEWRMNRKIRRILAYNKKHPEQCFHFEDHITTQGISPVQGEVTAESIMALMAELKAHSVNGVHKSLATGGVIKPLPLSVESLDALYPSTPFQYHRYLCDYCGIRPYMPTYASSVKVEAFDSEEERQAAYEHFKTQVRRIQGENEIAGGERNV